MFMDGKFINPERRVLSPADEPQYGSFATTPFIPQLTTDVGYFILGSIATIYGVRLAIMQIVHYTGTYGKETAYTI